MTLAQWLILLFLIGIILFFLENYRSNHYLTKKEYEISSTKIPEAFHGKKIAFLSDLHNNELGKDNEKIWNLLENIHPDYIFIGGDMIVGKEGYTTDVAFSLLKKLSEKYPVYCGNGNHEMKMVWKSDQCPELGVIYGNYRKKIEKLPVFYLSNETMKLCERDDYIYLSELDLPKDYYGRFSFKKLPQDSITEQIGTCRKDGFHILLTHNPAYFQSYAAWGADLTLSGHVHGGIIRLPFLGGVIAPSFEIFPKYDAGLYEKEGKRMIISVGLGSHSIKIRLFNPPEIDVITLKRQEIRG